MIDFSPIMVRNAMYQASQGTNGKSSEGKFLMNEAEMRAMALNTLRLSVRRFKYEFGPEVVIAFDSENYWRSEVFPYYKKNRVKARDSSHFDWVGYKNIMAVLRPEFQKVLPYKMLEVPRAEADDVIAVLVKDKSQIMTTEPVVIVSSDKDFLQLQLGNPNVKQYSPLPQVFITYEDYDYKNLDEHIIRGDSSDGIPNILSDDDTFVSEDKRQVIMTQKRFDECYQIRTTSEKYKRNQQLIDFEQIPEDIQTNIRSAYREAKEQNRMKLMNYCIMKNVGGMLDVLSDF